MRPPEAEGWTNTMEYLDVGGGRLLAVIHLDDEVVEFDLLVIQAAGSVDFQRGRVALLRGDDAEDVAHVAADDLVAEHRVRVGIDGLELADFGAHVAILGHVHLVLLLREDGSVVVDVAHRDDDLLLHRVGFAFRLERDGAVVGLHEEGVLLGLLPIQRHPRPDLARVVVDLELVQVVAHQTVQHLVVGERSVRIRGFHRGHQSVGRRILQHRPAFQIRKSRPLSSSNIVTYPLTYHSTLFNIVTYREMS